MKKRALIVGIFICSAGISGQDEIFTTGFEPSFTVGGDVSGLTNLGETIEISLNGVAQSVVNQDGPFTSTDSVEAGQAYLVSIDNSNCTVTNESGIMPLNNVTDVNINCPPAFVTVYDVKQGFATGDVALQNMLVTACGDSGYYVQTIDADPDFNGAYYSAVYVFDNTVDCNLLQVGDRVDLNPATVNVFFDEIQLQNATYAIQSTGNQLPNPVITLPAALNTLGVNPLNAVLVEVQNVTVTNPDLGSGEFEVAGELVIDDRFYTPVPSVTLNENMDYIRGPLAYSLNTNKIEPRSANDLGRQVQLVINEVDYDQPGADAAEFIEIYNAGVADANLADIALILVNGGNSQFYASESLASAGVLPAGGYLVLVDDTFDTNTLPANTPFIVLSTPVQNGGPDGMALVNTATEEVFDVLSYEGSISSANLGFSNPVNLVEGTATTAVDVGDGSLSRIPNGVDSDDADTDWEFTTQLTPGTSNISDIVPPVAAALVINEVDYDQPGVDTTEFVEIYNPTQNSVDLSQYAIVLINGNDSTEYDRVTLSGTLGSNEFAVVGASGLAVPQGVIYIENAFASGIQNGGPDGVALIDNINNTLVDSLSYEGAINAAIITGFVAPVDLVEGTATTAIDTGDGSIVRLPDGTDSGDDDIDFTFSTVVTPGSTNNLP
ncbi:MAG: lamin tail domain-containing protein [Marinicella sp.]|nr:lamin tail domain-containing protein [Xanthomonadales bacterium]